MRKLTFVSAVAFVVAMVGIGPAFGAAHGTDRPWKGSGSGIQTITSLGPPVMAVVDGTLHASHMGLSTFHTDATNTGGLTFAGTNTVTAANGDSFTGPITGSGVFVNPTTEVVTFTATIANGTGRFAGATGQSTTIATIVQTANPAVSTLTFTFTGTISY